MSGNILNFTQLQQDRRERALREIQQACDKQSDDFMKQNYNAWALSMGYKELPDWWASSFKGAILGVPPLQHEISGLRLSVIGNSNNEDLMFGDVPLMANMFLKSEPKHWLLSGDINEYLSKLTIINAIVDTWNLAFKKLQDDLVETQTRMKGLYDYKTWEKKNLN